MCWCTLPHNNLPQRHALWAGWGTRKWLELNVTVSGMEDTYSTFFLAIHGNCFHYLSTRHWLKDSYSIPGQDKEFCLFLCALIASGILPPPSPSCSPKVIWPGSGKHQAPPLPASTNNDDTYGCSNPVQSSGIEMHFCANIFSEFSLPRNVIYYNSIYKTNISLNKTKFYFT
jgi:hypothetical protein